MNDIEKNIIDGYKPFIEVAAKKIFDEKITTDDIKEKTYERYRTAFFLFKIQEYSDKSRQSDLHKITNFDMKKEVKKSLLDFYELKHCKSENKTTNKSISDSVEIIKEVEKANQILEEEDEEYNKKV